MQAVKLNQYKNNKKMMKNPTVNDGAGNHYLRLYCGKGVSLKVFISPISGNFLILLP